MSIPQMTDGIYEENYLDFYDPVKCLGDLGEKWCNFKWLIYNIQLNPLEKFQSPVFTTRLVPKTHWYLEVELSSPGNLSTMKIALRRLKNDENVVSIVDVIYIVICEAETSTYQKSTLVYNNEISWSEEYSFSASFNKQKPEYVTVVCKLRPNKLMTQDVRHGNFDETLPVHLRKLLQSGELYDTVIQVGFEKLKAHFAILCARLPKLLPRTIEKKNGKRTFRIHDLTASVVKEMLKYAYTGQAYVELDSAFVDKEILAAYSKNFFQRCCWEDNPLAETFFNYETDSLSWNLKEVFIKSDIGRDQIELLRLYPSKLELSLDVLESEEDDKVLTLTYKFCGEEMPKPTIVSCRYFLVNDENKNAIEFGETKTLLRANVTQGKVGLFSLLQIMIGKVSLNIREETLVLRTDFKFCYGSYKSSIENLYEGQFDITQCTGCALLRADMERLYRFVDYKDIALKGVDGCHVKAHKAVLIARWAEAENFKVKEDNVLIMKDYAFTDICELLLQLYTGTTSK